MSQVHPKLELRDGALHALIDGQAIRVRALRARPVTAPDGEIVLMAEGHREVAMFAPAELDRDSRLLIEDALGERYLMPRINRILAVRQDKRSRVVTVETDRGRRSFAFRVSSRSIVSPEPDRLVVKDAMGNRFEIPSIQALDAHSRALLELLA
jgi:hypothetical protein